MAPWGMAPWARRTSALSASHWDSRLASQRVCRRLRAARSAAVPNRARSLPGGGRMRQQRSNAASPGSNSAKAKRDRAEETRSHRRPAVSWGPSQSMTRSAPTLRMSFIPLPTLVRWTTGRASRGGEVAWRRVAACEWQKDEWAPRSFQSQSRFRSGQAYAGDRKSKSHGGWRPGKLAPKEGSWQGYRAGKGFVPMPQGLAIIWPSSAARATHV
jgi:hypothetical protein